MHTLRLLSALIVLAAIAICTAAGQEPGNPPRRQGPPPRREFPKPDTALSRQMFEKMSKAIEDKADSPAVSVFQNIKVWTNMPAGRLLGMMRNWTHTLGVDCAHCHVIDQWDKDEKPPKLTARAMDKLEDDVNGLIHNVKPIQNDRARISCWTCHRGEPQPELFPARPAPPGGPERKGN